MPVGVRGAVMAFGASFIVNSKEFGSSSRDGREIDFRVTFKSP